MKNLFFGVIATLVTVTFLFSCSGGGNDKSESSNTTADAPKSMVDDASDGKDAKIAAGKAVFEKVCQACHQADGKGLPVSFPPLAKSDYLAADLPRAIAGVVNGLSGEITVNGTKFDQVMPAATLSDDEVAAAFTFVLNSFGNKGGSVTAAEVKAVRK